MHAVYVDTSKQSSHKQDIKNFKISYVILIKVFSKINKNKSQIGGKLTEENQLKTENMPWRMNTAPHQLSRLGAG